MKAYADALKAVLLQAGSAVQTLMQELFRAILNLQHTEASDTAREMMELLAQACGIESATALYSLELPIILPKLISGYQLWDERSKDRFAFQILVTAAGEAITDYFGQVIDVLAANCHRDKDVNVKADMLLILDAFIANGNLHLSLRPFSQRLFREVLGPVTQWKPGSTGAKIRKAGLICLMNMFKQTIPEPAVVLSEWTYVFPMVQTCMEDDYDPELRLVGCFACEQLLHLCGPEFQDYNLSEVCIAIRKRLDDSKDFIRIEICKSLKVLFQIGKRIGRFSSYREVLRIMFLHLDDPNDEMSSSMRKALEEALGLDVQEFIHVAEEALHRQKRQQVVKELLDLAGR